jgi:hypothetical protein
LMPKYPFMMVLIYFRNLRPCNHFVIVCDNKSLSQFLNLYSFSMQDGKILSLS